MEGFPRIDHPDHDDFFFNHVKEIFGIVLLFAAFFIIIFFITACCCPSQSQRTFRNIGSRETETTRRLPVRDTSNPYKTLNNETSPPPPYNYQQMDPSQAGYLATNSPFPSTLPPPYAPQIDALSQTNTVKSSCTSIPANVVQSIVPCPTISVLPIVSHQTNFVQPITPYPTHFSQSNTPYPTHLPQSNTPYPTHLPQSNAPYPTSSQPSSVLPMPTAPPHIRSNDIF